MPSRRLQDPVPLASPSAPRLRPRLPVAVVVAVAVALGALLAIVTVVVFRWLWRKLASRSKTAPSSPLPADLRKADAESQPPGPLRFTYDQLRRATSSFSQGNKLGQGGFGPVFRGVLPSGEEIAVKLMDAGSFQGEIEFQNELSLASSMMKTGLVKPVGEDGADRSAVKHVVFPTGFCSEDEPEENNKKKRKKRRKKKRKKKNWFDDIEDDDFGTDFGVSEDEVEEVRRKILVLVYDLMKHGSLQDALLVRKRPELMDWRRRYAIAFDVAQGLQFLHNSCDPPIIHGDIKPSNILLDSQFSAKIGDFGLARPLSPPSPAKSDGNNVEGNQASGAVVVEIDGEDNASTSTVAETDSMLTAVGGALDTAGAAGSLVGDLHPESSAPMNLEVASTPEIVGGYDKLSVDSGVYPGSQKEGQKRNGRDWWWRQDVDGKSEPGTSVKDYVMEWIGSEIRKERPRGNWAASEPALSIDGDCDGSTSAKKRQQGRLEWWASSQKEHSKKKKSQPREWWREEYCEELARKNKKKQAQFRIVPKSNSCAITLRGGGDRMWWQHDADTDFSLEKKDRKKKMSKSKGSRDWRSGSPSVEIKRTWRRSSLDWASGEIPKSGGVSSTPSMRGTVCYTAPECSGNGEPPSEKCDIYSFGVLLLVIVSGRRPLQVTASPMSEFERANLVSWARHLSHRGSLLDLIDPSLQDLNREQALLCITVALLCLQRSPASRPSSKEIVEMLSGDLEPPHLPLEFSPSPPSGFPFKSRKRAW